MENKLKFSTKYKYNSSINNNALTVLTQNLLEYLVGYHSKGIILISDKYKHGYRKAFILDKNYMDYYYKTTVNNEPRSFSICKDKAKQYKLGDKFYFKIVNDENRSNK